MKDDKPDIKKIESRINQVLDPIPMAKINPGILFHNFQDFGDGGLMVPIYEIARICKTKIGQAEIKFGISFKFKTLPEAPYTLIYETEEERDKEYNKIFKQIRGEQ